MGVWSQGTGKRDGRVNQARREGEQCKDARVVDQLSSLVLHTQEATGNEPWDCPLGEREGKPTDALVPCPLIKG